MPTVLITGAGRGFGRELLGVFAERGWTVFPLVRDAGVAAALRAAHGETCHPLVADVATDAAERTITETLGRHTSSLDLLVNNAGSIEKAYGLAGTTPHALEEAFRAHCAGALRCVKGALPFLRRVPLATVVNVSSRWGSIAHALTGRSGVYAYQIAKAAQNMLSVCLDRELAPEGIRVFAVHPGRLLTEPAASDADTPPSYAAIRFAEWVGSVDRDAPCGIHDLMGGGLIPW